MTRKEKAALLYERMSLIDDRYINEALNYKGKSKSSFKALTVLIALVSAFSVFVVLGIGGMLRNRGLVTDAPKLEENIFESVSKNYSTYSSEEELTSTVLSSSGSALIWLDTESNIYYATSITQGEENSLANAKTTNTDVSGTEEENRYKLWIMNTNGEVTSPELKESSGNISYRTVFDYDPELVLSDSYISTLKNVLR